MKNLILMFMLILSTLTYSQDLNRIVQISPETYRCNTRSGNVEQAGNYIVENGRFLRHGTWKLYIDGRLVNKGVYFRNNLQELVIYNKRSRRRLNTNDLQIARLQSRVNRLQKLVATH